MKHFICLLAFILHLSWSPRSVSAQVMIEFEDELIRKYALTYGDEFDGEELDKEKWMTAYPWARHLYCSMDVSVYTDAESTVKNGMLRLTADKTKVRTRAIPYEPDDFIIPCDIKPPAKNLMDFEYQSGMIFSKEKFTYGYYEIMFRADAGEGLWPAFWLFGADNQEIDIFEIGSSKTNAYHVDVHCKNGCKNYKRFLGLGRSNWGDYIETNTNWSTSYHRAAIHWTAKGITWFIDGTPIAWWKGHFKDPLSLIANIAVTNKKGSFGGMVNDKTKFPAAMEVAYIRVLQEKNNVTLRPLTSKQEDPVSSLQSKELKVLKKVRPEYRNGILKKTPDKVFLTLDADKSLEIEVQSIKPKKYRMIIGNQTENRRTADLKQGQQSISLANLPSGTYQVSLKSEDQECTFQIEMP